MTAAQKIAPGLWFNVSAEDAVNHYLSIFPRSGILEQAYDQQ